MDNDVRVVNFFGERFGLEDTSPQPLNGFVLRVFVLAGSPGLGRVTC